MIVTRVAAGGLMMLALATPALAAAPAYRLRALPNPGTSPSYVARAISANGTIAGEGTIDATATANTPINYGSVGALSASFTPTVGTPTTSFVRGVNDSGIAAGTARTGSASTVAILTGTGGVTTLAPLSGFAGAGANGINNAGVVAGYSLVSGVFAAEGTARPLPGTGNHVATVWNGGVATALTNPFGGFNSIATAINASGQVAGVANTAAGVSAQAVLWTGGVGTALASGNAVASTARAVSSHGWVAGRRDTVLGTNFTGSVWTAAGAQFDLAPVAGACTNSDVRGINASNTAVGFSITAGCAFGDSLGTLWQWNGNGYTTHDLNSLVVNLNGWTLYAPQAINDLNQIVGFGADAQGNVRGFLLTAVPEPGSWAMMIAGFGLIGATARRRRAAIA